MKVLIISLLSITNAVCELPPYLTSSFRSQPFIPEFRNPLQTNYGPPKRFLTSSPQLQYGPPKSVDFFVEKLRPTNIPGRFKENQNVPPRTNYGIPITENIIRPQNTYRTPSTSKDNLNFPKFSNIGNGPRIVNQHQEVPQATYGAPSKFVQSNFHSNSIQQKAPQLSYGAPSVLQQSTPQSSYNAPSQFSHNNQEFPQLNYGTPLQQQNSGNSPTLPQNNYNVPINSPKNQYRAPSTNNIETLNRLKALISVFDKEQLNTQYLPSKEPNNFQTSSKIFSQSLPFQQATQFRDNNISEQQDKPFPQLHLPVKAPNDFRKGFEWTQNVHNTGGIPAPVVPTHLPGNNLDLPLNNGGFSEANRNNVEVQQLDVRTLYPPLGADDINQNQADISNQSQLRNNNNLRKINNLQENKYLISTTTSAPVINSPTTPTRNPDATLSPNEVSADTNQKSPSTEVNNGSGPNVAVATAVAGANPEQQFYLVQPDGRLQRVVYQQKKQPGDAENEYVADYYFQNIQSEPNVVYTPLITLG